MALEIGLPNTLLANSQEPQFEDQLVADCKRGDLRAYERLYELHSARMKSIAFHMLRNRTDAEDAVQETFLKVYRAMEKFSGASALSTWIYRILLNTCYDHGRQKTRLAEKAQTFETGSRTDLPLRIALERALEKLNERHRTVFLLYEVEGLKHSEIAGILEVPEGTSRGWLFEAKRELKRMLTGGSV